MGAADAYHRIMHLLDDAPTIEADPVKHSVWAYDGKPIHCKKCGFEPNYALTEKNSVYCSHCGRRMDGDCHSG